MTKKKEIPGLLYAFVENHGTDGQFIMAFDNPDEIPVDVNTLEVGVYVLRGYAEIKKVVSVIEKPLKKGK